MNCFFVSIVYVYFIILDAPPVTHIPIIDNSVRSYSVQVNLDELTADYDYVKKATKNTGILIVDVREPDEVKEHGKIPNSVNIPCKYLLLFPCVLLWN